MNPNTNARELDPGQKQEALGNAVQAYPEPATNNRTYTAGQPLQDVMELKFPIERLTPQIRQEAGGVGLDRCIRVLAHIATRSRKPGYCYQTKRSMALELFPHTKHPQRTLARVLKALQAAELVLLWEFRQGSKWGKMFLPWHPNSQRVMLTLGIPIPPHFALPADTVKTSGVGGTKLPAVSADKPKVSTHKPNGAGASPIQKSEVPANLEAAICLLFGNDEVSGILSEYEIEWKQSERDQVEALLSQWASQGKDPLKVIGGLEIDGVKTMGLVIKKLQASAGRVIPKTLTPSCNHPHHYEPLHPYHQDPDTGALTHCPEFPESKAAPKVSQRIGLETVGVAPLLNKYKQAQ